MEFKLIRLQSVPIWEQLKLEEALFRADTGNYCLVNQGSPPAVIMGLSAKIDELLHVDRLGAVPVWRRFSGGGTVVVDEETLFVTFIGNAADFKLQPFPHDLFSWSAAFYQKVFHPLPFELRQNDYVFGEKKMGGNAQAFARGRFVHHTSFLWDYLPERMSLLKMPPKTPSYRQGREHASFLTPLKKHLSSKNYLENRVIEEWKAGFSGEEALRSELSLILEREHRKSLMRLEM